MEMKRIIAVVAVAALLAACKPSESNYRKSYEAVLAKRQADREADAELDSLVAYRQLGSTDRFVNIPVGADTLRARVLVVKPTADEAGVTPPMERFCVVAGMFRQLFNARALAGRLQSIGYADAFVVNTSAPDYYVVAATSSSAISALEDLRQVQHDERVPLQQGYPWVLQPASLTR